MRENRDRANRRADARELLAPMCDWFIEGFDIADLREAKALLDEPVDYFFKESTP